jgi:hypothetical protein
MVQFNSSKARRFVAALAATSVFGLVGAGAALADDSASLPAYGGPGGSEQGTVDQGGTPPVVCTPTVGGQTGSGTDNCSPGTNMVLGTRQGGSSQPTTQPNTGGNEVLGTNAGGGKLPATANAPSTNSAPSTAHATHRLVGNLPFTGLDLIAVALVGIVLLALGFGLRRLTHSPQVS